MQTARRFKASSCVLSLICVMYFITYIDRVNISTAAPIMQKDLGLSSTELGLAFSAFAYPYAFFQIAGGWLGDRLGPRKTLIICGLIWAGATAAIGLVAGVVSLFLARLLLGIGEGATFPTATRAMANWLPPRKRGFAQGITHAAARLGNAITPPLIALMIVTLSWRASFYIIGAVSLVWVLVWRFYFTDDPRDHSGVTEDELEGLPPARMANERHAVPWGRLLRRMLPVTLTDFCYGWMLWLYLNWLPSYFLHQQHLDLKKSAIFASGVFFAGVVGDTVGGTVSDMILKRTGNVRTARVSVIVTGFLGAFLCMLPVVFTSDLLIISLGLSGAFFFSELIVGPIWAVPMDIAPQHAGTASGFMNFGFGLAGMISPVVFGAIIDATGRWDLPFIASLGVLLVGAFLATRMKPDQAFIDDPATATSARAGGAGATVRRVA